MNNSIGRLIDGINTALRGDIIPRLSDEYATGQAIAIIDLLNGLKLRVDWDVAPLRAMVEAQIALTQDLHALLGEVDDLAPLPRADLHAATGTGRDLEQQHERIETWICAMVHALAPRQSDADAQARRRIEEYMTLQLRHELKLTARPMFAEISRGSDGAARPGNDAAGAGR